MEILRWPLINIILSWSSFCQSHHRTLVVVTSWNTSHRAIIDSWHLRNLQSFRRWNSLFLLLRLFLYVFENFFFELTELAFAEKAYCGWEKHHRVLTLDYLNGVGVVEGSWATMALVLLDSAGWIIVHFIKWICKICSEPWEELASDVTQDKLLLIQMTPSLTQLNRYTSLRSRCSRCWNIVSLLFKCSSCWRTDGSHGTHAWRIHRLIYHQSDRCIRYASIWNWSIGRSSGSCIPAENDRAAKIDRQRWGSRGLVSLTSWIWMLAE